MVLKTVLAAAALAAICAQDKIDNPEYKNWSGCKADSWVTMKMETEMGPMKSVMEQTHKLVEISADKAVVETSGKMTAPAAADLPPTKREIPAKVDKQEPPADAPKPEVKEGDEEIEVGGKKVKCHWVETNTEVNGVKTWTKIWSCQDIPGGVARMETKSDQMSMNSSATGWEKK
jgi:hypothetical protein